MPGSRLRGGYPPSNLPSLQKRRVRASAIVCSTGQYGHLNLRSELPRAIFRIESLQRTWPHAISIAGLAAVAVSFETGHVNTEW